jgi:hypothetical protein
MPPFLRHMLHVTILPMQATLSFLKRSLIAVVQAIVTQLGDTQRANEDPEAQEQLTAGGTEVVQKDACKQQAQVQCLTSALLASDAVGECWRGG